MAQGSTPDAVLRDSLKASLDPAALRLTDVHVDLRLPDRIITGAAPLGAAFRALAAWLAAAGPAGERAIAVWADDDCAVSGPLGARMPETAEGRLPMLIEATHLGPTASGCAAMTPELAEAADALGATIEERPASADGVARLALRFVSRATPSSAPLASHWGGALRGRRLLILRRAALDPRRLERSFAALGIATRVETMADAALGAAHAAAQAGEAFDLALICPLGLGADPSATLERLGTLPGGPPRIVMVGPEGLDPSEFPRVDRFVPQRRNWRRVIDALVDVARTTGDGPAERAHAIPAFAGRRILIAEDVRTNQALLRAMLAPTGASVAVASDGAQAVEAMQAMPADLVLMDIQMPVMDGLEATRQIRAMGHPARIIALTAHAREADRAHYLSSGLDGYLAKPIRVDDLYAVLTEALEAEAR